MCMVHGVCLGEREREKRCDDVCENLSKIHSSCESLHFHLLRAWAGLAERQEGKNVKLFQCVLLSSVISTWLVFMALALTTSNLARSLWNGKHCLASSFTYFDFSCVYALDYPNCKPKLEVIFSEWIKGQGDIHNHFDSIRFKSGMLLPFGDKSLYPFDSIRFKSCTFLPSWDSVNKLEIRLCIDNQTFFAI